MAFLDTAHALLSSKVNINGNMARRETFVLIWCTQVRCITSLLIYNYYNQLIISSHNLPTWMHWVYMSISHDKKAVSYLVATLVPVTN